VTIDLQLINNGGEIDINSAQPTIDSFVSEGGTTDIFGNSTVIVENRAGAAQAFTIDAGDVVLSSSTIGYRVQVISGGTLETLAGAFGPSIVAGNLVMEGTLTMAGDLDVQGTLNQDGGSTAVNGCTLSATTVLLQGTGSFVLNNGTVTVNNNGAVTVRSDFVFAGAGTINAPQFNNAGTLYVGGQNSVGTLALNGAYTQFNTRTIVFDVQDVNEVVSFDQFIVSGTATLAGTITVSAIGDINRADLSGPYQIMSFASLQGGFTTQNGILGQDMLFTLNVTNQGLFLVPTD
jgi:hypothetical protein